MLNAYSQPEIVLAPAWSGIPILAVLLDGDWYTLTRCPGIALDDAGACYTVRLKQIPADVAVYVRERMTIPDGDWWWVARSGRIEVSLRVGAMPKIREIPCHT
jgi:hypothetical protein